MSIKKVKTIEYEPEMSFTEIARELGISQVRVMELYTNAMTKLMKTYVETQNGKEN